MGLAGLAKAVACGKLFQPLWAPVQISFIAGRLLLDGKLKIPCKLYNFELKATPGFKREAHDGKDELATKENVVTSQGFLPIRAGRSRMRPVPHACVRRR